MLRIYLCEKGRGLSKDLQLREALEYSSREGCSIWVDLDEAKDEEIRQLGELFRFHPLTIDDCLSGQQRPKVEVYEDYLFMVLRDPDLELIRRDEPALELDIFLGRSFLVTIHRQPMGCVAVAAARLETGPERLLGQGPDALAHLVIDLLVDDHALILNKLDEEITQLEDQVMEEADREVLNRIAALRKILLYLQRLMAPQREAIRSLLSGEIPFITPEQRLYFRDIHDHLVWINDLIVSYREIIAGARDMYLSVLSNRMNAIMKTLTVIATIFIPLTFVAGLWGMNFQRMPGLSWR
jgi:magnesium transporter